MVTGPSFSILTFVTRPVIVSPASVAVTNNALKLLVGLL